jgi:hypothetical protein
MIRLDRRTSPSRLSAKWPRHVIGTCVVRGGCYADRVVVLAGPSLVVVDHNGRDCSNE